MPHPAPQDGLALLRDASLAVSPSNPATSVRALLNPAPTLAAALPAGYVLGKDGNIRKKRGRKPTPGLSDDDRRLARLLKNRRTAEASRRRKLALLVRLTTERDDARATAAHLQKENARLAAALAAAEARPSSAKSVPSVRKRNLRVEEQSDVSRSEADSQEERRRGKPAKPSS